MFEGHAIIQSLPALKFFPGLSQNTKVLDSWILKQFEINVKLIQFPGFQFLKCKMKGGLFIQFIVNELLYPKH